MYDLSKEMNLFYYNKVVLPNSEKKKLREKKKNNVERLFSGLKEYNQENTTDFKIAEVIEQGSVAMSTVTQNEENDYDIDVAIIFDKDNLDSIGHRAIKNIVANALERKCSAFNTQPEILSNCVRIKYSDNYHIDFAIYRRFLNWGEYSYEHAGATQWNKRDPRAINNWFKNEIKQHGEGLRQVIRLSKMFCKSRSYWEMPGGLIQSVLCDEVFSNDGDSRLDEIFYNTLKKIVHRLKITKEIDNPTDSSLSLLLKEKDKTKVKNLETRIERILDDLEILFENDCTIKKAKDAWKKVFNHEFWDPANEDSVFSESYNLMKSNCKSILGYDDTEEFIGNFVPIALMRVEFKIDCRVKNDVRTKKLRKMIKNDELVPLDCELEFYLENVPVSSPYKVFWKVKNNGEEAIKNNQIRGQILDGGIASTWIEHSAFPGNHFVECYIIKDGICVAEDKIDVFIDG
jgi:hypothetical protein